MNPNSPLKIGMVQGGTPVVPYCKFPQWLTDPKLPFLTAYASENAINSNYLAFFQTVNPECQKSIAFELWRDLMHFQKDALNPHDFSYEAHQYAVPTLKMCFARWLDKYQPIFTSVGLGPVSIEIDAPTGEPVDLIPNNTLTALTEGKVLKDFLVGHPVTPRAFLDYTLRAQLLLRDKHAASRTDQEQPQS